MQLNINELLIVLLLLFEGQIGKLNCQAGNMGNGIEEPQMMDMKLPAEQSFNYRMPYRARGISDVNAPVSAPSAPGPASAASNLNVTCGADTGASKNGNGEADAAHSNGGGAPSELQKLVQSLYVAQAQVQLEAKEIQKAQAIAAEAQKRLEESANHVRVITAALQSAQQEVAAAAMCAQTAQLQLAAHDQLLFAARQKVDALSSQMVGLQAQEGIIQPKVAVDIDNLLKKLREPLAEDLKPTRIPSILGGGDKTARNARLFAGDAKGVNGKARYGEADAQRLNANSKRNQEEHIDAMDTNEPYSDQAYSDDENEFSSYDDKSSMIYNL